MVEYKLKTSNLEEVKHLIPDFIRKTGYEKHSARLSDINKLLADGWLVIPNLNARVLNGRDGYSSHVVLIYKKSGSFYELHDPGLPGKKAKKVPTELIKKAMQYIGPNSTSLMALRLE